MGVGHGNVAKARVLQLDRRLGETICRRNRGAVVGDECRRERHNFSPGQGEIMERRRETCCSPQCRHGQWRFRGEHKRREEGNLERDTSTENSTQGTYLSSSHGLGTCTTVAMLTGPIREPACENVPQTSGLSTYLTGKDRA